MTTDAQRSTAADPAASTRPLEITDVQGLRGALGYEDPAAISPDSALVAFTIRSFAQHPYNAAAERGVPSGSEGLELAVAELKSGAWRSLTSGWDSSWGPRWSPDGRWLAFYSDRSGIAQVWLWDRETNETRLACADPVQISFEFEVPQWLPDSPRLVTKLRTAGWQPPPRREPPAPKGTHEVWVSPPEAPPTSPTGESRPWYEPYRGDLAIIDIRTGEAQRLATDLVLNMSQLSPDGRYLAASCYDPAYWAAVREDPNSVLSDLHLLAVDGSRHEVLRRRVPMAFGTTFSWSPANDALAYHTYGGGPSRVALLALDGTERVLDDGSEVDFGHEEPYPPPLWSADGRFLYCWSVDFQVYRFDTGTGARQNMAPDQRDYGLLGPTYPLTGMIASDFGRPGTVVVVGRHRRASGEALLRLTGGEPEEILPNKERSLLDVAARSDNDGHFIVSTVESQEHPRELCVIDVLAGTERRLTDLNPHLAHVPLGTGRLLTYTGADGSARRAALFLPPDYQPGQRYPTIVNAAFGYGGVSMLRSFVFSGSGSLHLFTTRGYAVLFPNVPVQGADAMTARALEDVDAAVAQGYSDPDRLGVMGFNLGGYATCCIVTRTDRFRAAVAVDSFTNLISWPLHIEGNHLGWLEHAKELEASMGGTIWEVPEQYVENSPLFHLHRVTTPLLLLHGTENPIPISQSEEIYAGLRRLGKVATLVRYYDEEMGLWTWSQENLEDLWYRSIAWFDRYL